MKTIIKKGSPETIRCGCLIVALTEARQLTPAAERVDEASGGLLTRLLRSRDISAEFNRCTMLNGVSGVAAQRVLVVGAGKKKELSAKRLRKLAVTAMAAVKSSPAKDAVTCLTELEITDGSLYTNARHQVEAANASTYQFYDFKSTNAPAIAFEKLGFIASNRREQTTLEKAVSHGSAIGTGVRLAKDLGNTPANHMTPTILAERAKELAASNRSIKYSVLEETDMKKLGMGSLLSVSQGSRQPAKLIVLEYKLKAKTKPYVLVGKGVTFDSGGISIKPSPQMDEMKWDMAGAASVLGTLAAVAEMKLEIPLVVLIPATENLPDGLATKPGDVVTSMSGQTIEILNTDAEGRLILCDTLTYAERYEPKAVIDVATLTGACVIALGSPASGLYANEQSLADELLTAGQEANDRAWQMPLWDDYQQQLDSNFADMQNIGGREAGSVTAACFLARFAKQFNWAHLDIAGTAWLQGKAKGGTGRPVPMLTQYLLRKARAL